VRIALAALCLLAPMAGLAWAQGDALSLDYERLLRRYAAGERESAVAEMAGWPEEKVLEQARALLALWREARACRACPAMVLWRRTPIRAALLLHTDAADRAHRDGRPSRHHDGAAIAIARVLKDDPPGEGFARRWFEATARLALAESRLADALQRAEQGRREFPGSATLLIVVGAVEETFGRLALSRLPDAALVPGSSRTAASLTARREALNHLEDARRALHSAVKTDPSLPEAHLQLGRVAWRLGKAGEARAALEEVFRRQPGPPPLFLAHLFLGRLDEDAGRFDEAARSYEAALALDPSAQSARLALSHAELRLGRSEAARREVEGTLGAVHRRREPDPYWLYPGGPVARAEDDLEALRREASP